MRSQLDAATSANAEHYKKLQEAEALTVQKVVDITTMTFHGQQLMHEKAELALAKSQLEAQLVVYTRVDSDGRGVS